MNILFLTQEYPPETGWGGVGTQKYSNARALAQMGHQVHVLAAAVPPSPTYEYEQNGVHVHRVRRWKFEVPLVRRLWHTALPWTKHQWEYMVTVRAELKRLVAQYAIECIEGAEIWGEGLLYSFARRAPIVVKLSGPFFLIRKLNSGGLNLDWTLVDRADEMWTKRADQITSSSKSLAQIVGEKYRISPEKIRVVSNPVDTERFFPSPQKTLVAPTILYTGRIEPRKGILTLVEAIPGVVRAHPQARFVLVGADSGGLRAHLQEQLEQAGVSGNVEIVGHVAYENMVAYYQSATVCVFPSLYEPFGNVCLEAMACGKPVVATNAGGFAEIVREGETGLLVPPQDARALANAIQTVLGNPTRAHEWGENGRRRAVTEYSSTVIAKRSLDVYAETAARWKHGRDVT